MGRARICIVDSAGQRADITSVDAKSAADVKKYWTAIKKYSKAAMDSYSFSTIEVENDPKPDAKSNVDSKAICIGVDERGVAHTIPVPGFEKTTANTTMTPNGERLDAEVVKTVVSAWGDMIGKKLRPRYGYPIQKK